MEADQRTRKRAGRVKRKPRVEEVKERRGRGAKERRRGWKRYAEELRGMGGWKKLREEGVEELREEGVQFSPVGSPGWKR